MAENKTFGYCRVSSRDQNLDRQIEALEAYGVDRVFKDKVSGVREHKPEFEEMIKQLRKGDKVVVLSFDRLARSVKQLLEAVERINQEEADLISLKENVDTTSPQGRLVFHIMASIAEFEREMIKERQREGIAIAKEQGRIQGRPKVSADSLEQAITLYQSGKYPVCKIAAMTGVSRNTLYRALSERGITSERKPRPKADSE